MRILNFIRRCIESRRHFEHDEKLVLRIQERYKRILNSIGNRKQVEQESQKTLRLIEKLQATPLHSFVSDDIGKIKNSIKRIKKNPREHKLKYLLASAYIISPGTFEATGIFLFLRYSWKYALHYKEKRKAA